MSSWYETCTRKLFFDFHSPGTAVGLARDFDAERWAERLQEAAAQAVSVFTKCGYGYSFHRRGSVRYVHPQLAPGLDMLEAQIEALHRRGLKAIGYYHTFNSEPIAKDHPDWIERDVNGNPRGISICMMGPLAEEWMLPHLAEIVGNYAVDSMFFDGTYIHSVCYCAACRKGFADATGGLALPKDDKDTAWGAHLEWKFGRMRALRQRICAVIHGLRPEVVISFNWAYSARQPETVPDAVGALVADIQPDDQSFTGSFFARYWSTLGRPFDVMNSAFLQWWGDWGCKPASAMQQEVATVIAHGGLTWIGYQMTHTFDVQPAVMGELRQTLEFVREREPLLHGARPVPTIAALHPTHDTVLRHRKAIWCDESSPRGLHRLLTESMIPYHLVQAGDLVQRLDRFQAVILPDQRWLDPALVQALPEYVRSGGVLIATALTGTLDAAGQETHGFALGDLLGLRLDGVYDQTHAYIEVTDEGLKPGTLDMPHLVEGQFAFATPVAAEVEVLARLRRIYLRSDGSTLLRWSPVGEDSGYPAITVRRVGKGCAAYIAGQVFRGYQTKNQWNLKHIVANLLQLLIEKPLVAVEAPAWVEVVLMEQPTPTGATRLLVHLVNHHGNRPVDKNNVCVEQVLPVRGVVVRLRCEQRPSAVTLEPGSGVCRWSWRRGLLTVRVPQVQIHTAVAVAP
jgi:hypothetical protein